MLETCRREAEKRAGKVKSPPPLNPNQTLKPSTLEREAEVRVESVKEQLFIMRTICAF